MLEEYPLLTIREGMTPGEFKFKYSSIDKETKAQILEFHDPAENLRNLEMETIEKVVRKNPDGNVRFWRDAKTDKMSKIFRIIGDNHFPICMEEDLYDTTLLGLYNNFSLINHSCVANATSSWVMGDFEKKQLRAMTTIEKNQEILVLYQNTPEFYFQFQRVPTAVPAGEPGIPVFVFRVLPGGGGSRGE